MKNRKSKAPKTGPRSAGRSVPRRHASSRRGATLRRASGSAFGMMGLIGWSAAVVPTLIGAALGIWLDRRHPGSHSWTLALLVAGLAIGCFNAWHWVAREDREMRKEQEDNDGMKLRHWSWRRWRAFCSARCSSAASGGRFEKGVSSTWPTFWFFGSLWLRMGITLAGFHLVAGGHWERLLACLRIFHCASCRYAADQGGGKQARLAQEVGHAS